MKCDSCGMKLKMKFSRILSEKPVLVARTYVCPNCGNPRKTFEEEERAEEKNKREVLITTR